MKTTFITTVFNEEKSIDKFLRSLVAQSKIPDEIIIVDGASRDKTFARINNFISNIQDKRFKRIKIKILVKQGNRSVGRNEAIKNATGDIIICSDSGNVLDKDWLKNITRPFSDLSVDVVAGYYKGKAKNIFQKCLIPYALVMPDKINPDTFLPATRSIAFTKKIWKKIGGFDEQFSHNEDYVFANKLKQKGAKIVFAQDAIVYWIPRNTFKEAFIMFFRFALGDAESGIWRTNVLLLFARYTLGLYFITLTFLYRSSLPISILAGMFFLYIFWSIKKNYKYVNDTKAISILPLLQFTADGAVLVGSLLGGLRRILRFHYFSYLKQNTFLFVVLAVYVFITVLTLKWGIPGQNHPFPYNMDEWHQLQAVANTFRYGTPNTAGSANGTMFHFILSGFYLIPFTALNIINPFELQIDKWFMRERVFEILRVQTILFGSLSIIVLYYLSRLVGASRKITIFLFTFTPLWLMLSGYFKYDIALVFWIILSMFFLFRFAKEPNHINYFFAAIPSGLAVAVKISAIPLLPIYILSYFMFRQRKIWSYKYLLGGIILFFGTILLFGMPDTLFGKGNIYDYLYNNIIQSPSNISNFRLTINPYVYLFLHQYPIIFGPGLLLLSLISLFIWSQRVFQKGITKNIRKYKRETFLIISFLIFLFSLLPLHIWGGGNRALVLLPFLALLCGITFKNVSFVSRKRIFVSVILCIVFVSQIYWSSVWVYSKIVKNPQAEASFWIEKNISRNTTIGLENIPIYQGIPDNLQKEFYFHQYGIKEGNMYNYQVLNSTIKELPKVIVITNDIVEKKLIIHSDKNDLVERLKKEGYKRAAAFTPEYTLTFINDVDYFFSWLLASPSTIAVYVK